ncbi:acyl dehydratase [Rhodococcus sp. 27YEA15]|uniref:MaoC/PaaZ C-terminal domain-containing protein n=1 Tax=Rhodococcus sp. 27YEA15 TaxID=3156259 RepID=UPI003C7D8A56
MSKPSIVDLVVGDVVASSIRTVTRDSLVRYAGASGDFNPIHYRDDIAEAAGLPGVLAHGLLTTALAVQTVADWIGDSTGIVGYETRFTRPVVVDPKRGASIEVTATIGSVDHETQTARLDLTVTSAGATVLGKTRVTIYLGP